MFSHIPPKVKNIPILFCPKCGIPAYRSWWDNEYYRGFIWACDGHECGWMFEEKDIPTGEENV